MAERANPDPRPDELRRVQPQLPGGLVDRGPPNRRGGNIAVSEVRVPHPTVGPHYALSFLEVEGGRLARGREYWVEERYEKPGPERARWFERM
jgi:hypothetical protein